MILEELMLDLMYHLPGNKRIKDFEVTAEMVQKRDLSLPSARKSRLASSAGRRRSRAHRVSDPRQSLQSYAADRSDDLRLYTCL